MQHRLAGDRGKLFNGSFVRVGTLTALVTMLVLPFGTASMAGHGPVAPGGPYSGFAHGTTLHVDALTVGDTRVANIDVGLANAAVRSTGLTAQPNAYQRLIAPDESIDKHSHARSSIAEIGLVSDPSADAQLKPFEAVALAPPPESEDKTALNQAVGPALFVSLANNVADATWNDDTCVVGRPISTAQQHLARAEVLETADDPTTPPEDGFDAPIVAIDADQNGPPRAATHTIAQEELFYPGSGNTLGLRSFVHSTLAPVTLFQGTPNELTIEVDGPAFLDVRASGKPGGATVEFNAPIVTISQGGDVVVEIPPLPAPLPEIPPIEIPAATAGDVLAEVKVGALDPIPADRGGLGEDTTTADGTKAAAQASIVQIRILDLPSAGITGATISLGHMEAAVDVPPDGITCPIPVSKSIDRQSVVSGQTFQTVITVRNPFDCVLTDVKLSDVIEVEGAALFRVSGTSPEATASPGGQNLSTGTVEWDLGTIQPGEEKSVTLDLVAQGGAGVITDTATATGTLTGCEAVPATGSVEAGVANIPVSGSATARVDETAALPTRLPRTGATNAIALGLGLLVAASIIRASAMRLAR